MYMTINEVLETMTDSYLANLLPNSLLTPMKIEKELVNLCRDQCMLDNNTRMKGDKLTLPQKLVPVQVAKIMLKFHHIVRVKSAGSGSDPEHDLLALYCTEGENRGIYVTDETEFARIAASYDYSITTKGISEVMALLKLYAPRVERCMGRDLIAVNNGVFNYEKKTLEPFSPDRVFMAKSKVNYNPNAINVTIHNDTDGTDWDVESWMSELSDDKEVVDLLWEILGAVIRPYVRWNKSAWLYSNTGNNGKGTLCELMRSLCGNDSYASIPLSDFSKDFALEPLIRTMAIIVDENDVGAFIDKAGNLKAVITNDVVSINRKFKMPISYQFYGFMVQCLNEFPRIRDKSDSFYRRQLFIPFDKCFTGRERKYIKNDYLHRPEVLEYVMYRVLHMNYYTLSEPLSCKQVLEDYKEFNDPVRQFLDEILPQLKWDMAPFSFLYDLYKSWFRKNNPTGSTLGRRAFGTDVINLLTPDCGWYCKGRNVDIRPGKRMEGPEPLIVEYGLTDWQSKTYIGSDLDRISTPTLKANYKGLLRCGTEDKDG